MSYYIDCLGSYSRPPHPKTRLMSSIHRCSVCRQHSRAFNLPHCILRDRICAIFGEYTAVPKRVLC